MFDENAIKKLARKKLAENALPYAPISDEFITAREFASLVGMSSHRPQRRLKVLLSMISQGKDPETIPAEIRECFAGQKPVVHVYQGKGSIDYEYRIAIKDLSGGYVSAARQAINGRSNYVKPGTLKKLRYLSMHFKTDISSVIDILVNREIEKVQLST